MRRLLVAAVTLALTSMTAVPAAADMTPDRAGPCAEAWAVVDKEAAILESGSTDAWARVSDAFMSLSDGTFDGPLSNAFGDVAVAASDLVEALQSDVEGTATTAAYDASLAALGSVCAQLSVTRHAPHVAGFQRFTYQTGRITGLSPVAGRRANTSIAIAVRRAHRAARLLSGSYVQTLRLRPCTTSTVCVDIQSDAWTPGSTARRVHVTTLTLDARTGQLLPQ